MTECDCPLCPIIAANMQVCDIRFMIINYPKTKSIGIRFAGVPENLKHLVPNIADCIHSSFLPVLRKNKVKVGCGIKITHDTYIANIDRETGNEYKLCFHTISKSEDPN